MCVKNGKTLRKIRVGRELYHARGRHHKPEKAVKEEKAKGERARARATKSHLQKSASEELPLTDALCFSAHPSLEGRRFAL